MAGRRSSRRARGVLVLTIVASLLASALPAMRVAGANPKPTIAVIPPGNAYRQRNLVSDVPGMALVQDPYLVGSWGIARTGSGPFRVANDSTSTSTSYRGDLSGSPLVPRPERIVIPGSLPTGIVSNSTSGFVVSSDSTSGPASFIFATITGNIVGWNPSVPAGSTTGIVGASQPTHLYTGLAISGSVLYAADFGNSHVDVYDSTYAATTLPGSFADPTIPAGYRPFNIQALGGSLYVTYATAGSDGWPVAGVGIGYVRRFNTDGVRDLTFEIDNGALNDPWGLAFAPASFGLFGGALLVGNAGSGNPSIHAFNGTTGAFLGTLQDESGAGIEIDGLQGMVFGNGGAAGSENTLYFAAATARREHGLFGSLSPTTASATSTIQFSTDEYSISEAATDIEVTVTRNGDSSGPASIRYATWDVSQVGHAWQKSDYELNVGVVTFGPGESSRTFAVHAVKDRFAEGNETIGLVLSNPTGAGVGLGSPNTANLTIVDNDSTSPTSNPIDETPVFVRQHYLDLLSREPEASRLAYWSNIINACGTNAACRRSKRVSVSSQFLMSTESVDSLGVIYRLHKAAFGTDPWYGEVVFSAQVRRSLGETFMTATFMSNPRFVDRYGGLTNAAYVNTLVANSTFNFPTATKNAWISGLNNHTLTRAAVLLKIAHDPGFFAKVRSRWIVLAAFWDYLRRDPDTSTFNARLNQLNAGGGDPVGSGLVETFIYSPEYRQRFGPS